jgi:hypothetical protein
LTPERLERFNRYVAAADGEALFRPSSASRWLNCPGSVSLASTLPRDRTSSSFAKEGTAAHLVFNEALSEIRMPEEWTGRRIKIDEKTGEDWLVDAEMEEAVKFAVSVVEDKITHSTEKHLEYFLSLAPLDPSDIVLQQNRGTADVALVDKKARKLTIMDLKYGQGVRVEGDSPQLLDYALMGLVTFGVDGGWEEVESVVIQPRSRDENDRVRSHIFHPDDLLIDFAGKVVSAFDAALDENPSLSVDPTGKWCRWCPAKSICPALQASGMAVVGASRGGMVSAALKATSPMPPIPKEAPVLVEPSLMGVEAIATVLERRKVYDAWIEAVEDRAMKLLQAGAAVPGWELGQRQGNRAWVDPQSAANTLRKAGASLTDLYPPQKLVSPAQAEKLLPKDKRFLMNDLVERPLGALYLKRTTPEKGSGTQALTSQ